MKYDFIGTIYIYIYIYVYIITILQNLHSFILVNIIDYLRFLKSAMKNGYDPVIIKILVPCILLLALEEPCLERA